MGFFNIVLFGIVLLYFVVVIDAGLVFILFMIDIILFVI